MIVYPLMVRRLIRGVLLYWVSGHLSFFLAIARVDIDAAGDLRLKA